MVEKNRGSGMKTTPRLPLNRNQVLAAAVEIADERGIGAVTMREVASRLGVEAMSLYNHVANKDDILDGMVDLMIEQVELPSDAEGWREAMRCRAVRAHQVFGRHPWVPMLVDSRETSGPSRMLYLDWVLGTLMKAGFSLDGAARAFSLLDSYIYGFGIQQFNMAADGDALARGDGRGDSGFDTRRKVPLSASDGIARDGVWLRRRGRLRLRAGAHPRRAGTDPRRAAIGLEARAYGAPRKMRIIQGAFLSSSSARSAASFPVRAEIGRPEGLNVHIPAWLMPGKGVRTERAMRIVRYSAGIGWLRKDQPVRAPSVLPVRRSSDTGS